MTQPREKSLLELLDINTGGSEGADTGAMDATFGTCVNAGGFVPQGYLSKPENIDRLASYDMVELSEPGFSAKDRANVEQKADALIAILQWDSKLGDYVPNTGMGTTKTVMYAHQRTYTYDDAAKNMCKAVYCPEADLSQGVVTCVPKNNSIEGSIPCFILYVIDGNLETFAFSDLYMNTIIEAARALKEEGRDPVRLMVSGPTEAVLPNIQKATKVLFSCVIGRLQREAEGEDIDPCYCCPACGIRRGSVPGNLFFAFRYTPAWICDGCAEIYVCQACRDGNPPEGGEISNKCLACSERYNVDEAKYAYARCAKDVENIRADIAAAAIVDDLNDIPPLIDEYVEEAPTNE